MKDNNDLSVELKSAAKEYGEKHKKEKYSRNTHLETAFLAGAQYRKQQMIMAEEETLYNDGYNQGLDHAMKLAAVICDHMMVKQISNVFLLEFAIKLAELKELQARPINKTVNKSQNGNIDTWNS